MDASDEFKFVVVGGRSGKGLEKKKSLSTSVENLRTVPVCVYNTNKNLKLQFWNRAFKLFQSQRTVYRAVVSGINYQDGETETRSGTSRSRGIALRAKSLSHSHLSGLGTVVMDQAGTAECCQQGGNKGDIRLLKVFEERNGGSCNGNNTGEIARNSEEHDAVPVAMPRKRTVSRLGGGKKKGSPGSQRPVSISGGEKPEGDEGRMDDNCISMGNNIHIPFLPAHLRRTQSVRSHCSSSGSCLDSHHQNHHQDDGSRSRDNPDLVLPHPRSHRKLTKALTELFGPVSIDSNPCSNSSSPCPGSGRNFSDSCSEIASNLDSGLDTWKDHSHSHPRSPSPPGMRPKLKEAGTGIVCTISQRIPSSDGDNNVQYQYDDSLEKGCGKMRGKNNSNSNNTHTNTSGNGNTTVVLINGCFESELCQSHFQYDSLNLSEDYDYECLSEIDLNSSEQGSAGSGSGSGMVSSSSRGAILYDKEKLTRRPGTENELDSLDLTLFEAGRKAEESAYSVTASEMKEQSDEPLYDSVCSDDYNTDPARPVAVGNCPIYNNSSSSVYINAWSDAGSEFEFMAAAASKNNTNREIVMGHTPRGNPPEADWEPYFCVLSQLDQIFTSYRSEEMSLTENGISPTEVPRVRLDGGPNSIKCLINNAKWGMNTLLEEEEESALNDKDKHGEAGTSGSTHRNSSALDTSYDKACSAERRSSAPLTPILGRETSSRFANFFSKRSFKSNPLKRTKSVTKLERKKPGSADPDNGLLYPSRLRTSRSHESLLAWTNHSVSSLVNNGMMSTTDLAGGNVTIRPLHPSVLGQDFAFQISTPVGSKYYLCSSAAERDAWVYALIKAIKPHADEIRRQDNSLKIWVLEAKGIPGSGKSSSKKYFCELYLDDCLYARTCGKTKGEMLFWGEHFEFTQLPSCVQMITVVLFREGDKKKKKERNTCIGRVKIPVNSVNSRYLIEKWYPVVPDSTSQSGKEKECPSMRVKCKYQSVEILPVRCYRNFLQYIKNEYGPVSECLESVLSVKAKEDLASALVHVLHHEGLAKEFIAELALQEILKSGDEKLTFRGNSIATKAMEAFLKLTGTEYLHASLGPFIEHFQKSEDVCDCEVDPMKLAPGTDLSKNQSNLRMAVDTVWKQILHSHSIFPAELRDCFSHCREALRTAGKEELSDHLISASIFLRFLCPAVLSPSLFNITNEYPSEKSARNLTLVAKVLQTLANFTRFQGKESYMEFINDFVEKEAPSMKAFLSCISSPMSSETAKKSKEGRDRIPAGGFIDLGKYSSILSACLTENVAKIAPKNDRFKPLQELLEQIHHWLKQPPSATIMNSFPFPHVTSPAPTIPPPPAPTGIPVNFRGGTPPGRHSQSVSHHYQVPTLPPGTPIYAVSNASHNNANPRVRNINGNWNDNTGNPLPLQLQIPNTPNPPQIPLLNNSGRSGSQASSGNASSGYQSQSPVLEGEDKAKKLPDSNVSIQISNSQGSRLPNENNRSALTFTNPVFAKKVASQSVDNLNAVGVDLLSDAVVKRRLARSSSSSDCEYPPLNVTPSKHKLRNQAHKEVIYGNLPCSSNTKGMVSNNRLSRRSSAELLRRSHPYSSSTDEESDNRPVSSNQGKLDVTPQLPPRRGQLKRASGGLRTTPLSDNGGYGHGERLKEDARHSFNDNNAPINCSEYEREMVELRCAMEALQSKLCRAEERLFGQETNNAPTPQNRRGGERKSKYGSPGSLDHERNSFDEQSKEVDNLLQRFLHAEEDLKREQELLVALDRKQKLIDAQEEKISRLDSVNNQLLDALAQIRDTLQQQQMQQHQQRIQQQLLYQKQELEDLYSRNPTFMMTPNSNNGNGFPANNGNGNRNIAYDRMNYSHPPPLPRDPPPPVHSMPRSSSINNLNNNTTKVLITANGNSNESVQAQSCNVDNRSDPNRNSVTYLGEQALKMLAELKSSSC